MLASVICFNLFYVFFLEFNIYVFPNIRQAELVVVQSLNRVQLCTPKDSIMQVSLSFNNSQSLLKHMSIELVRPFNHFILYYPLFLPSVFPSITVFSNELTLCIIWPKYWSFSFSPSNECSGLISFKIGWFDLLAVQETLKVLQHHA